MEQEHPFLRDVFPDLAAEVADLLEEEGEHDLAAHARDLRLVGECDCGDDFCQSLRTAPHPKGQPFGEGHRCVTLEPPTGMLVLDVVDDRIMYVEVIDRPPLRRRDAQR
ncbi:hypothetical protein ABTX81_28320 [Kitasatospora sp. NPDC097605]|uniref:hypothetical protein n=1 Tax=Kitasatospora sp. NPDC097605 TaxID=3157226 RepID=UPI00331A6BE6